MCNYIKTIAILASLLLVASVNNAFAITQFYFAIPEVIEDTTGITFSVEVDTKAFSWTDNGTSIVPANNNTPNTQADDTGMDLDANEYLLAVDDNLEIGKRVYMCVELSKYFTERVCETDAIDKNHVARASFQFLFK
jgi:hypothetical protein